MNMTVCIAYDQFTFVKEEMDRRHTPDSSSSENLENLGIQNVALAGGLGP